MGETNVKSITNKYAGETYGLGKQRTDICRCESSKYNSRSQNLETYKLDFT
jgi:hypothetical protein